MAFLGATLLTTFRTLALGSGKSVTRRMLAAISAIGIDLIFQLFDPRLMDGDLEFKRLDKIPYQSDYGIGSLIADSPDLLIC